MDGNESESSYINISSSELSQSEITENSQNGTYDSTSTNNSIYINRSSRDINDQENDILSNKLIKRIYGYNVIKICNKNNFGICILLIFLFIFIVLCLILCGILFSPKKEIIKNEQLNGYKYSYIDSNNIKGTLYLNSDKLIGKNYEIIHGSKDNDEFSFYVFSKVDFDDDGYYPEFEEDTKEWVKEYDCSVTCICEFAESTIAIPYRKTIFRKGTLKQVKEKFLEEVRGKCEKMSVNDYLGESGFQDCFVPRDNDIDCILRKETSWSCNAICILDNGEQYNMPEQNFIVIVADSEKEAVYIAENYYFDQICEDRIPWEHKDKEVFSQSMCEIFHQD